MMDDIRVDAIAIVAILAGLAYVVAGFELLMRWWR